ncbi:MAG: glycosyltransferase [Patescibacteria group bacterium]
MSQKKILFIITKSNWGGAQRYVFDLATRLSPTDFDVSVLFGGHGVLADKLVEKKVRTLSFEKMWRDINFIEDVKAFFKLVSLLRAERPDIVHLNSSKIGGLGALAARIAGIPKIIFTVHGFAFNEDRPQWQKLVIKCISWITMFLCTDVIFISKTEHAQIAKWPLVSHKGKIIYNGIETPEFYDRTTARSLMASTLAISQDTLDGKPVVLTIAELTHNKGLIYALEAMRDLPEHIYIIIGGGECEQAFRAYIHEHTLENRVFLAGFVKNAAQYLHAADIFLLPSIKEGLPYVLIEAGFAELPTVATYIGGIAEIIEDQKTGTLIQHRSASEIVHALKTYSENPVKAREHGSALLHKVQSEFSSSKMIEQTSALYLQKS